MKILSEGKEKEIRVLTYFKLDKTSFFNTNNNNEYILYTDDTDTPEKNIYLAKLFYIKSTINLILPDENELPILKNIVQCFLSDNFDLSILLKNKYEYIDIKQLENYSMQEVKKQSILISKEKYIKMISNKYLTYPEMKILNIEEIEKEGYDKNNEKSIKFSLIGIGIYFLLLILIGIFSGTPNNNIFKLTGFTILMWSLVTLLISMVAYNFEERRPLESWIIVFIVIIFFILLLMLLQHQFNIYTLIIMSVVYSLIFTIPYALVKLLSFSIINKIKSRNFITYYAIYLLPFLISIIALIKLYDNFLYKYINLLLDKF